MAKAIYNGDWRTTIQKQISNLKQELDKYNSILEEVESDGYEQLIDYKDYFHSDMIMSSIEYAKTNNIQYYVVDLTNAIGFNVMGIRFKNQEDRIAYKLTIK